MDSPLEKKITSSLMCMVGVSVLLQLVLPMVLSMEPVKDLVRSIPMVGESVDTVVEVHSKQQIGGSVVIALITILAAYLAPYICGAFGMK